VGFGLVLSLLVGHIAADEDVAGPVGHGGPIGPGSGFEVYREGSFRVTRRSGRPGRRGETECVRQTPRVGVLLPRLRRDAAVKWRESAREAIVDVGS